MIFLTMLSAFVICARLTVTSGKVYASEGYLLKKTLKGYAWYDTQGKFISDIQERPGELEIKQWGNLIIMYGTPEGYGFCQFHDSKTGGLINKYENIEGMEIVFSEQGNFILIAQYVPIGKGGIILVDKDGKEIAKHEIYETINWGVSKDGKHIAVIGSSGFTKYLLEKREKREIPKEELPIGKEKLYIFNQKGELIQSISIGGPYKGKIEFSDSGKIVKLGGGIINVELGKKICGGLPNAISSDEKYAGVLSDPPKFPSSGSSSEERSIYYKIVGINPVLYSEDEFSFFEREELIEPYIDIFSLTTGEKIGRIRISIVEGYKKTEIKWVEEETEYKKEIDGQWVSIKTKGKRRIVEKRYEPVKEINFTPDNKSINVTTEYKGIKKEHFITLEETRKFMEEEEKEINKLVEEIKQRENNQRKEQIEWLKEEIEGLKHASKTHPEKKIDIGEIQNLENRINDEMNFEEIRQIEKELKELDVKYELRSPKRKATPQGIRNLHEQQQQKEKTNGELEDTQKKFKKYPPIPKNEERKKTE